MFQHKLFTIGYSLFLMVVCGIFSWHSTTFFGIPCFIHPTIIVKTQNFINRFVLNYHTTNGIG